MEAVVLFAPQGSSQEEVNKYIDILSLNKRLEVIVTSGDADAAVATATATAANQKHNILAAAALFAQSNSAVAVDFFNGCTCHRRDLFLIAVGDDAVEPKARLLCCDDNAVHMATNVEAHLHHVLVDLLAESMPDPKAVAAKERTDLACPLCGKKNLSAKQLWVHFPMYHVNVKKNVSLAAVPCPLCPNVRSRHPLIQHFHEEHAPPGVEVEQGRASPQLVSFGLCVIQRKSDKKFLVVQEYCNQGYWLPGGGIDAGEFPTKAAIREAKEEAGIDVELTGLLRVECTPPRFGRGYMRMRYIFYGHPKSEDQPPKTIPDFESVGAAWVSVDEVLDGSLKLRGGEPTEWFKYVADGGAIQPIDMLTFEGAPPPEVPKNAHVANVKNCC